MKSVSQLKPEELKKLMLLIQFAVAKERVRLINGYVKSSHSNILKAKRVESFFHGMLPTPPGIIELLHEEINRQCFLYSIRHSIKTEKRAYEEVYFASGLNYGAAPYKKEIYYDYKHNKQLYGQKYAAGIARGKIRKLICYSRMRIKL